MGPEMRDPLKDPRPGDVVRHKLKGFHSPGEPQKVEAVVGNVVAFTVGSAAAIHWCLLDKWCEECSMTEYWEVLHVAAD